MSTGSPNRQTKWATWCPKVQAWAKILVRSSTRKSLIAAPSAVLALFSRFSRNLAPIFSLNPVNPTKPLRTGWITLKSGGADITKENYFVKAISSSSPDKLFGPPSLSPLAWPQIRNQSWREFISLFSPPNIVSAASGEEGHQVTTNTFISLSSNHWTQQMIVGTRPGGSNLGPNQLN